MHIPPDQLVVRDRRPAIGMLFGFQAFGPGSCYGFVGTLMRGVRAAARDHRANFLLASGINLLQFQTPRPAWPIPLADTDFVPVGPWNTDGLIVVHPMLAAERTRYIDDLQRSGFPIVFVGNAMGGLSVDVDNEDGIRQAVRHLAEHGHRRVAFIAGYEDDEPGDSGARLRGFRAAAQEFGLEVDPRLIAYGQFQIGVGKQAMRQILGSKIPFTAVLASNDEAAEGAIQALMEAGLRVPQDVAVIGFDDRPDGAMALPSLTTVHHPVFQRGYRAVELLLDRIAGRVVHENRTISVPTRLVIRRSCGCAAIDVLSPTPVSAPSIEESLTHAVTRAIFTEAQDINLAEIRQQSQQLINQLVAGLRDGNVSDFFMALQSVLSRTEQIRGDARIWTFAIDALDISSELTAFVTALDEGGSRSALLKTALSHARTVIQDCIDRQYWYARESAVSEERGSWTARLLSACEETEILKILSEHLPKAGIRSTAIVFFEAEGEDPVSWSLMCTTADPAGQPVRFRSREFPPPLGTYGDAFNLVLVPLPMQQGPSGYMVFDADNLELCGSITQAVMAALNHAHAHHQAIDGRMAEEAYRMKSRFLSTIGHELRTPLSLILNTAEILTGVASTAEALPEMQRHLARIRAGAQHLEGLIRDVLDLAKDDLDDLTLSYDAVDLRSTLEPVLVIGEHAARAKGLDWQVDIAPSLPQVWADRARVRQIVMNLVTNAVKFTAVGAVKLRVFQQAGSLVVSVCDTGFGVSPSEHDAVFADFYQSQRTARSSRGGLGLGLSICRRLADMHAGKLWVESTGEEGRGSTFYFSLPVVESSVEAIGKSLSLGQNVVLVCDLDDAGRQAHAYLIQHGFNVRQYSVEALSAAMPISPDNLPGAIILDGNLLAGDGWKLLRTLRSNGSRRDIQLLIFSLACGQDESVSMPGYLSKPVGTGEMAQALRRRDAATPDDSRTILVVDDDPELLGMHAHIVQSLSPGYCVLTATSGVQALSLIHQHNVDLVLLDLLMPGMDGFSVIETMQKSETARHIPVIVLTGQVLDRGDMARLNRGAAEVLQKGVFTVEETLRHIQQTLMHGRKLAGDAQARVRQAMVYMNQHYAEPLTRSDVARHVGISDDHLTRYFHSSLGISPMTYLTRYRVSRAKMLLDEGKMSVASIAGAVGIQNEFYFSRFFRRETGLTPTAYRRGKR